MKQDTPTPAPGSDPGSNPAPGSDPGSGPGSDPATGNSPTLDVYLNGQMLPPDRATVRLDDAGLQHAVGLFETFGVYHGQPFRLPQHLDRLANSSHQLGLTAELDTDALAAAVQQTIDHNGLSAARMRLTVTAGPTSMLKSNQTKPEPTVAVVPAPPTEYDPAYFQQGVLVAVAPAGANPFDQLAGHKTLAYWGRLRTLRQAAAAGAGEAIWLNVTNHLASGAVSNLFLVKDGKLLTPIARGEEAEDALPAPVRPGVIRAAIIEIARAQGIEVERRMLAIDDLLGADEAFLTNSSWLVLPVRQVEQTELPSAGVGPVTKQLRAELLRTLVTETGGEGSD